MGGCVYEIDVSCCYDYEWGIWRLREISSECYVIVYRNVSIKPLSQDVQTVSQNHLPMLTMKNAIGTEYLLFLK